MGDDALRARLGMEAKAHIAGNFPVSGMIRNIESYITEMMSAKNC
jgi:hypothetical protein